MTDTTAFSEPVPDFELPNAGAGPDPFSLSAAAADPHLDAIVLLFQRGYHCGNCRKQVQAIADRYGEFEALNASAVSTLPKAIDRAAEWQDSYDLSFTLLADPNTDVSDAYDQPVRFGVLDLLHDLVGRMPVAMVLDVRSGEPVEKLLHERLAGPAEAVAPDGDRTGNVRDRLVVDENAQSKDDLEPRTKRAVDEAIDVSLLSKGGRYEVQSASGNRYEADAVDESCTCLDWQQRSPEGGCKHLRRVDHEIKQGNVPRPDGRLPTGP